MIPKVEVYLAFLQGSLDPAVEHLSFVHIFPFFCSLSVFKEVYVLSFCGAAVKDFIW